MTSDQQPYTSLTSPAEKQQPEAPAAQSPRHADWISYAVAVTQQAAPTATDFSSNLEF